MRPPQSNYPPDSVPPPDNGGRLESRQTKDGISPLAPPPPKGRVQSLPSILRIVCPKSLSSCSTGARGVSVYMRENGIFTGTASSLCLSLRLLPERDAARAGRNFGDPDVRAIRPVHACCRL